jgi:hypothetical protein
MFPITSSLVTWSPEREHMTALLPDAQLQSQDADQDDDPGDQEQTGHLC